MDNKSSFEDNRFNRVSDTYLEKNTNYFDKFFDNTITLCCIQPILYFCYPENKSKQIEDVLYIVNNYTPNVSDYVYAGSKNDIIKYEVSDFSENGAAFLAITTLNITSREGSCILSAIQKNFKISIKLQWSAT
jgi:hypothetical protein